jgi:PhnB protein
MARSTKPIPEGLPNLITQLVAKDARALIAYCEKAFGAALQHAVDGPDGKIIHGYMKIGDAVVFISDASGFSKLTVTNMFLYVPDVDAVFARATAAGGKAVAPVSDMFWGDRWGMVEDPFGNHWQIATHIEDVAPDELMRRMKENAGKAP